MTTSTILLPLNPAEYAEIRRWLGCPGHDGKRVLGAPSANADASCKSSYLDSPSIPAVLRSIIISPIPAPSP